MSTLLENSQKYIHCGHWCWRLWGSDMAEHTPRTDLVSECVSAALQSDKRLACSCVWVCSHHVLSQSLTHPREVGRGSCAGSRVNFHRRTWWSCFTRRIRATCTGCQWPVYDLARAPAHSPSPAEGCGRWGGGGGASFPPIRFDAEERGPTKEGRGRGCCEWWGGAPSGKRRWSWSWWWWSRRNGADWSCESGCSELSWARSSTGGGRKERGERLRKQEEIRAWLIQRKWKKRQLPWKTWKQELEQSQKKNRTIKQKAVSPCDGGLEPATTKLESVTAPAAPHSSGMGKRRKWLSMSITEGKRRCCTRHWPHSVRERRRCCRDRGMEAWGHKNMERERLSQSWWACFPLISGE